jgi:hypothetical protein
VNPFKINPVPVTNNNGGNGGMEVEPSGQDPPMANNNNPFQFKMNPFVPNNTN